MKRQRFFLGRVANPTWKDFVIRVGGALGVVAAVILVFRELVPGYEGIATICTSAGLIGLGGFQEWRQNRAQRKGRKG